MPTFDTDRRRLRRWVLLLLAVCPLFGPSPARADVPFEILARTGRALFSETPRLVVIRSRAELETLWRQMGRRDSAPDVDFRKRMVLAYSFGVRGSGGHRFDVEGVEIRAGTMWLRTHESAPGPRCAVPLGGSLPGIVVSTIPWPHDVEVDARREVVDCEP